MERLVHASFFHTQNMKRRYGIQRVMIITTDTDVGLSVLAIALFSKLNLTELGSKENLIFLCVYVQPPQARKM